VHADLVLKSGFTSTGGACQGSGALSEYQAGRNLVMENQDSRPVATPVLKAGVATRDGCEFRVTVTMPSADRSLWLPMSELGIAACRPSHRGAVVYDRSTYSAPSVNTTLGFPRTSATAAAGRCQ
jgi:hypothetical protein